MSVSKPSARISSCGSRVSYGVIAFPSYNIIWSTISKCLQLPGCGRYEVRLRQRRYDKKKDWLVSLSACRLSYPSVNGKIFTRFVDGLSFEFALSNPRRTPVLSFKFSLWIFRPYNLASWFGLTAIRSSSEEKFRSSVPYRKPYFLRPTLLKLHISAQLIESFTTP